MSNMNAIHLKSILLKNAIFSDLDRGVLARIIEHAKIKDYPSQKMIVRQGENPSCLYFILSGTVKTTRATADGQETVIRILKEHSVFMEAVIFMMCASPINAETITKTTLLQIPRDCVEQLTLENITFANNLLKAIAIHYKTAIMHIEGIMYKNPVARLGNYLLQEKLKQSSDEVFSLNFKKNTIAHYLGMTPETFSRALKQLQIQDISVEGAFIRLQYKHALCQFCDDDHRKKCDNAIDCPNKDH